MSKTIESSSITPLLLQLDKGEFAPSEYDILSNELTRCIVEITRNAEEAKVLLNAESKKITERGNGISNYLSRDNVEMKEALETYYRGVIDTDKGRNLSKRFTITEKMLMLGVFTRLMVVREKYLEGYKWNSRKLRIYGMIQRAKCKIKGEKLSDNFELLQNIAETSRIGEERMLFYLRNQVTVLMNAILEELGISFKSTNRGQLQSILVESQDLCDAVPSLKAYFEKREADGTPLYSDVALLDACGENHPDLYSVLATETYQDKKEKRK